MINLVPRVYLLPAKSKRREILGTRLGNDWSGSLVSQLVSQTYWLRQ